MEYIEEFFDTFKLGNPVMLHWYYDGYYEDFSWESNEVSIPPILLEEYGSVEKLNNRIQELKQRDDSNYKREIDAVDTEYGKISGAYIKYPSLTNKMLLELICLYSQWCVLGKYNSIAELKESILKGFVKLYKSHDYTESMGYYKIIQDIFNEEEDE